MVAPDNETAKRGRDSPDCPTGRLFRSRRNGFNHVTEIREASPDDASDILNLHVASIREFGPEAYEEEQVAAWAAKDDRTAGYPHRRSRPLSRRGGGQRRGRIRPFRAGKRRDTCGVRHPDAARTGVGSAILAHLEGYARSSGLTRLESWASLNAVGFYHRMGYRQVREETVGKEHDGREISLPVSVMEKSLGA